MDGITYLIEQTGNHPLTGVHRPGRHRALWTVPAVVSDAALSMQLGEWFSHGRRRAHRAPPAVLRPFTELDRASAAVLLATLRDEATARNRRAVSVGGGA